MTEAEWLTATDPTPMLEYLKDKASGRKIRLFVVACARAVWDQLSVEEMRTAVETGERLADNLASEDDRFQMMQCLYRMPLNARQGNLELSQFFSTSSRERFGAYLAALVTVRPDRCHGLTTGPSWDASSLATGRHQPGLLRDIFGNPFRPVAIKPEWLSSTVVALAHQMYESRDFGAMPSLADALQDAGCDSDDVLDHCRGPGPHVRGCWVVDLVLGKE